MPKGYYVPDGYRGMVNGIYRLFATESDYLEFIREYLLDADPVPL